MKTLRYPMAAIILFATLALFFVSTYEGVEDAYNITAGDLKYSNETGQTLSIAQQFKKMNLVEGVNDINAVILDATAPTASQFDILGALASVGIGILKLVTGIITAPFSIANIILTYYAGEVGSWIFGLLLMITVLVSFILLSAYLRSDV